MKPPSLVPAEEDDSALTVISQAANREPDGERVAYGKLIHEACESALAELAPRDRLALSLYYVKEKTLAEIGRIIGEHEATVSRRLDRVRCFLRENTEERLRAQGLGEAQIELCFECALQDGPLDLSRALDEETGAGAPPPTLPPKKPAPGNTAVRDGGEATERGIVMMAARGARIWLAGVLRKRRKRA